MYETDDIQDVDANGKEGRVEQDRDDRVVIDTIKALADVVSSFRGSPNSPPFPPVTPHDSLTFLPSPDNYAAHQLHLVSPEDQLSPGSGRRLSYSVLPRQ